MHGRPDRCVVLVPLLPTSTSEYVHWSVEEQEVWIKQALKCLDGAGQLHTLMVHLRGYQRDLRSLQFAAILCQVVLILSTVEWMLISSKDCI